jgi:large subunit ribosomal protein L31
MKKVAKKEVKTTKPKAKGADLTPKKEKAAKEIKITKPTLHQVKVICTCGNEFTTLSTSKDDLKVEICSACHPLYTGTQKLVDATGQVEKYKERLAKMAALKKERSKKK